jgi:glycine/serine hydroxymethyltransferase
MEMVACWIERIIENREDSVLDKIRQEIRDLCDKFPISAVL